LQVSDRHLINAGLYPPPWRHPRWRRSDGFHLPRAGQRADRPDRPLLNAIDVFAPVAWVELAAELGWYDQAHLTREFTRHPGV